MRDLSMLGSQQQALAELEKQVLPKNSDKPTRTFLRGPSGCGKTWIVQKISEKWPGAAVVVGGNEALARRSLGAWWHGISTTGPRLSGDKALKQAASAATRIVPLIGPLLAALTDFLATNRSRLRRDQALYLKSDEFKILCHLDALARGRRLLLVTDDLQHWDQDSSQMLSLILSGRLDDVFPFLTQMSLLVAWTDGENDDSKELFSDILDTLPNPIHLTPITSGEMGTTLRMFGFDAALDPAQLELLYAISGGHLELLRQLADYLKVNPAGWDLTSLLQTAAGSSETFLASILVGRLLASGEAGRSTLAALEAAAVIGKTFSVDELKCLLQTSGIDTEQCLVTAQTFNLLTTVDVQVSFRHEILRTCLMLHGHDRAKTNRRKFADCLSLLRPFDYFSRSEQLREAGLTEEAARLSFAGLYKRLRDGHPVPDDLRQRVFTQLLATDQDASAETILSAHKSILARQFSKVSRLLAACENIDHPLFVAERLHLLGLATLQSVRTTDRRAALAILLRAVAVPHGEKELEIRLKQTLLTAYVHLEMWDEARQLDQEICGTLASLLHSDPGAREGLEIQRRKSGMLYGAEVAKDRCAQAANYFGPQTEAGWPPRNPIQFFMAQCNLAGNLIVAGDFEQADQAARTAMDVSSRLPSVSMPRVEKVVNNSVVAGVLSSRLRPEDAVVLLEELRSQNPGGVFSRLIRNNCAIFRALSGDVAGAHAEFRDLVADLDDGIEDEFYRYFISSNLAGLLHVSGQSERGLQMWRQFDGRVPAIPESDRCYLLARQTLQVAAFAEVAPGDIVGWDNYLQSRWPHHLGPGWRFYGRGLLLTDTQIWLES